MAIYPPNNCSGGFMVISLSAASSQRGEPSPILLTPAVEIPRCGAGRA